METLSQYVEGIPMVAATEKEAASVDRSLQSVRNAGGDGGDLDKDVSVGCENKEQESHIDTKTAKQECDMDTKTMEQERRIDTKTAEQECHMNTKTAGVFSKQKILPDTRTAGNCGTYGSMVSGTVVLEGRREAQVLGTGYWVAMQT